MLRLLVEFRLVDVRAGAMTLMASCKATSCRASSRISYGAPDDVIAAASKHVRGHVDEFSKHTMKWTAGPTKGDP